jgi:nucleotide-binding universal stress UspA family protein
MIKVADDVEPELLVIGTHGRTGLARLSMGSIAERVVAAANCSVLVVRIKES